MRRRTCHCPSHSSGYCPSRTSDTKTGLRRSQPDRPWLPSPPPWRRRRATATTGSTRSPAAYTCRLPYLSTKNSSYGEHDSLFSGNPGLPLHLPAQFGPMEDRGERQIAEEEDRGEEEDRMAQRPHVEPVGMSIEVQLGRKLREIGDKFNQDHVELVRTLMKSAYATSCNIYGWQFQSLKG
uniref:Uncharacterized protein n=1 Tax=Cyprinodon variegatus TaxID=28743 RepID=A0A3Q2EJW6_CYPVA